MKVGILMEREKFLLIPSLDFERHFIEVLPSYLSALCDLDVSPPIVVMLTLQGIRGARLGVSRLAFDDKPAAFARDVLELPEVVVERYGTAEDYHRALRPAFDALWNAAGYFRSRYFDQEDRWVGEVRS